MLSRAAAKACAVLRSFADWPPLLACLATLLVAACSTTAPFTSDAALSGGASPSSSGLYVVRRDWHIDVGFKVDDMSGPLNTLAAQFPGVRYLVFGFGDRRYLKSRQKGLPNMAAALWPGPGLILMTALAAPPAQAFGDRQVLVVPVSPAQLRAAQELVWISLTQHDNLVQTDGAGPYEGSVFLDAVPDYSAVHTCNTWAAQVLKAAGLPVHTTAVVFAWQLWGQVHRLALLPQPPQ